LREKGGYGRGKIEKEGLQRPDLVREGRLFGLRLIERAVREREEWWLVCVCV
jgi:hypothetical protein